MIIVTASYISPGINAQMGKISGMLTEIEEEMTPLQKRLAELGKIIAVICLVVCAAVAGAGILRGEPVFDMLMTGITIAIAAIIFGNRSRFIGAYHRSAAQGLNGMKLVNESVFL